MKRSLFIFLFIIPTLLSAQFLDDFNASKPIDSHQWKGDVDAFEITENGTLRSKTITTTSLSSANSLAYGAFWEFGIQLDFNPSAQNQLRVYLIADRDSLKKPLNGYFVLVGESGDTDRFQLYKQKGETISLVISSLPKDRSDPSRVKTRVRVTRDSIGKWNLYTAEYDEDFVLDGSAVDDEFRTSSHFGIHCRFTSGNSDKFHFDYFQIDTLGKEDFFELPAKDDSLGKLRPSLTHDVLFIDTFKNDLSFWAGETDKFRIQKEVLLNSPTAKSPSFLHIPNLAVKNRLWEAGFEVNGLLTTQNNIRLYLSATNDSLPGNQQGYQLQIDGAGGNHTYKLYKQNNASRTLLFQSVPFPTRDNKLRVRLKVTCNIEGEWKIYTDEYNQGEFTLLRDQHGSSSIVDLSHSISLYSGWMTRFSSTRTEDYSLHYFLIKELDDSQSPEQENDRPYIVSTFILDSSSIGLNFNTGLDELSASNLENYWLSANYEFPAKSILTGSTVIISFADTLLSGNYELSVKDITDTLGSIMADTLISFYYEAPESVEPENPWEKLKPDAYEESIVFESFDNDLSIWSGETDKFRIQEKVLLNSPTAKSPSFLHIPNLAVKNRLWEAGFEVNGLLTTQNNIRLYLSATNDSLPGNQQGYQLQIDGAGGNHTYKLYKQNNASRTLLFQSVPFPTRDNKLRVRLKVTCTIEGEWKIYTDEYDQGEFTLLRDQHGASSIVDLSHSTSLYSGWMTRFSSTRSGEYALHYFLIKELDDSQIPDQENDRPYIVSTFILDSISIGLNFNRGLDELSASRLENYCLSANYEIPVKSVISGPTVIISFADTLLSGNYELSVKDITDILGSIMTDTLISFYYEAPESVEPENPWEKLKPDAYEESIVFESFDNDLSIWSGETDKFRIQEKVLLNSPTAKSPSFLHIPNLAVKNRLWEAGFEVNGLLTTQNNIRLYLSATNDSLPGNQQGYQLQIDGAGGNHTYKLYKQNNASRTLLFQSVPFPTRDNKLRVRLKVTCTIEGEWKIYTDEYDQGEFTLLRDQHGASSIVDFSHSTSLYSGWMTRFSSTRTEDYSLHYFLIKELDGNLPDTGIPKDQESTYIAKAYDVIINEIMADPKNPIGLPEIEYIELKNLSDEEINLRGWTYSSLTRSHQFKNGSIPPKSLVVLYKESDSTLVNDFDIGDSLGLASWPPLVNAGTKLTLKNEEGLIIDEVEYKSSWYRDTKKSNGGWSLERMDPFLRCEEDENWKASIDPSGGTPGRENSVNEDKAIQNLSLIDLNFTNPKQIQISFNKKLDPASALLSNYRINNGLGAPDSVTMIDSKSLILFYDKDFLGGYHYQLSIENIVDCIGNKTSLTKDFFLPEAIAFQDILINEVLADPLKDGVEFVEIYNNSQKALDLNSLSIGTVRQSDGVVLLKKISEKSHLMPPSSYRLLSPNSQIVSSHYPNSKAINFIQMPSFPQLKNSNGTIVIQDGETQIDRLDYHENMHDKLIANKKGVSLERTSFTIPTNAPGNFKSAAATEGYATPGYKNSQFKDDDEQRMQISLKSKTFSPDHDGFEDVLEIDYFFPEEEDLMATIDVYNDSGLLIKRLVRNHRLSSSGTIYWDGLMENSRFAPVGIYILAIEVYNSRGFRKIMRESCVLASKF